MSEAHCRKFPDCWEIGENKREPKCDHPDCPGNRTWADVIAPPPVVHSYDEERHYSERLRDWAHDWNQPVEPLAGALSLKGEATGEELIERATNYLANNAAESGADVLIRDLLARVAELERALAGGEYLKLAREQARAEGRAAGIEEAAKVVHERARLWANGDSVFSRVRKEECEHIIEAFRALKDKPDAEAPK